MLALDGIPRDVRPIHRIRCWDIVTSVVTLHVFSQIIGVCEFLTAHITFHSHDSIDGFACLASVVVRSSH